MNKLKKIVGFYHRGDLDGISSAAILNKMFSHQDLTLIGVEYGDIIDEMKLTKDADIVYVIDFTFEPFDRMLQLHKERNLIWIDHHKTSLQSVKLHPEITFKGVLGDNTKSAAHLAWEYFFENMEIPYAIKQISLFDTWQHKGADDILNFYYGLEIESLMNPTSEIWNKLFTKRDTMSLEVEIEERGQTIRNYNSMVHAEYAKNHAFETEFEGYKAIVINMGLPGSMKFKAVYDASRHDIMISFARRANRTWKFSVYSEKNNIDCSVICKKYGGGGHKGSAGFEIKTDKLPFKI